MGVVVFGMGRAGSIHVGNLLSIVRAKLVAVADAAVDATRAKLDGLGAAHVPVVDATDEDAVRKAVWENGEVRAVVVSSPTWCHEETVRAALRAGKAVLCEKPLSSSYAGTRECYALAKELGQPLMVAFQRRFDPTYAACRQRVLDGAIGKVEVIKSTSRDNPVPSLEYLKHSGCGRPPAAQRASRSHARLAAGTGARAAACSRTAWCTTWTSCCSTCPATRR